MSKVINLLPQTRQKELRYEAILHSFILVAVFSLLSFAMVFLAQFGLKFYLQLQLDSIKSQIGQQQTQVNKQENAEVIKKINEVNGVISDYVTLANASPNWARIIKAFSVLPPPDAKIFNFTIDPFKRSISINGFAPTREVVIQFYNNVLQDSQEFHGIDYPLENVSTPTNNSFHFTFFVNDSLWTFK